MATRHHRASTAIFLPSMAPFVTHNPFSPSRPSTRSHPLVELFKYSIILFSPLVPTLSMIPTLCDQFCPFLCFAMQAVKTVDISSPTSRTPLLAPPSYPDSTSLHVHRSSTAIPATRRAVHQPVVHPVRHQKHYIHLSCSASPTAIRAQHFLHTSTVTRDAPQVLDLSPYKASSTTNNRALSYVMVE
jgi:hypothetical protein